MNTTTILASAGALIGDPSRAAMLSALMGGQALTAGELAREAGVTPATASAHLGLLLDRGAVTVVPQGRHRYYRLADAETAAMIEDLTAAGIRRTPLSRQPGPRSEALRHARTCYDHLAGELGVRVHDALVRKSWVRIAGDGIVLAVGGMAFLATMGTADREAPLAGRLCLDWSERRSHLGGPAGRALLDAFVASGWLARPASGGRALIVTRRGRQAFADFLA
jgi:DNA-binding transcriptional ArsR family regulator